MTDWLPLLIVLAGVGQLGIILVSLALPRLLGWHEETAKLRPLIRQLFWTYAAYIWTTNLSFGLLSALAPGWLLDRSGLAAAVTGFITLYWGARLAIQFLYFDRSDMPVGPVYRLAELLMVASFCYLTGVYAVATAWNLGIIGP